MSVHVCTRVWVYVVCKEENVKMVTVVISLGDKIIATCFFPYL